MITEIIPEIVVPGKRLGRQIEHDHQSRGFQATVRQQKIVSKDWKRYCDAFDQGDIGSCTGNAMAGALTTEPFFEQGRKIDESLAVLLYSFATRLDYISGHYPPDDTGSSGLAVAKVAHKLGYIRAYHHTFTLAGLLASLSHTGPVIVGISWYSSFDNPVGIDSMLEITSDAEVRGGHEVELLGIDAENRIVKGINSWGRDWGTNGRFTMSFDTLHRLLDEKGDCVVPIL